MLVTTRHNFRSLRVDRVQNNTEWDGRESAEQPEGEGQLAAVADCIVSGVCCFRVAVCRKSRYTISISDVMTRSAATWLSRAQ